MRRVAWLAIPLLLGLGCSGSILDGPSRPAGTPDRPGPEPRPDGPDVPAPASRFPRLTHDQWRQTAQDLLRIDALPDFGAELRADPRTGGFLFDNYGGRLEVDQILLSAYERAAAVLAEHVTSDADRLSRILPSAGGTEPERARAFVEGFGLRAHRRPLEAAEVDEYLALYELGRSLYLDAPDPFTGGVRLVIEAMLQSPLFLYRTELSTDRADDAIPLSGYEVASRLSYFLWNTMPDDTLFAAAGDGSLGNAEGVRAAADRMLADARATDVAERFHEQLLDVERWSGISPSSGEFPEAPAALPALARSEFSEFIREVVWNDDAGITGLLTSSDTFVNQDTAPIYGLAASDFGASFQRVTLDTETRRGFLTQVGFLASHATSRDPDPIHRGVYIATRLACIAVPAPPDSIPELPAPMGRTNRETIESLTEVEGSVCAGCHSTMINPFGFPLEHYDAIGALRELDQGFAIDATSAPVLDGSPIPVDGAVDLAETLAASPSVHRCYARHWLEYALGRPYDPRDVPLVTRLGRASSESGLSARALLAELSSSIAFRARSQEELP